MKISDISFCLKITFLLVWFFSSRICSTQPAALVRQSITGRRTWIPGRQVMMQRKGEDKTWSSKKECRFPSKAVRQQERGTVVLLRIEGQSWDSMVSWGWCPGRYFCAYAVAQYSSASIHPSMMQMAQEWYFKKRRRNKTTLLESFTMLSCSRGVLGVATAGKTSLPSSHWHTAQQPIYVSTWLISLSVTDLGTPSPLAVKLYWLVCFFPHKLLSGMGGLGTEQPWLWQQQESTF